MWNANTIVSKHRSAYHDEYALVTENGSDDNSTIMKNESIQNGAINVVRHVIVKICFDLQNTLAIILQL